MALWCQCITFALSGWIVLNNMMMQTIGKTLPATVLAASRQGLFFIPALLILPALLDLFGIQMAQAAADVCTFAITTVIYLHVMKQMDHEMYNHAAAERMAGK